MLERFDRQCIELSYHMMVYKDEGVLMLLQNHVVILSGVDNWRSAQLPGNYQGALHGKRKAYGTIWGATYACSQPENYIKMAGNISAFKITFKNSDSLHCFVELPRNAKRCGCPNALSFAQWLRFPTQSLKEQLILWPTSLYHTSFWVAHQIFRLRGNQIAPLEIVSSLQFRSRVFFSNEPSRMPPTKQ